MELSPNNLPENAIHYYSNGFSFIKKTEKTFICENHKNASFPTLERECGIFFADLPIESEISVYVDAPTPLVVPAEMSSPSAPELLKLQLDLSDNDAVFEDAISTYRLAFPYPINKVAQMQKAVGHPVGFHHTDTFVIQCLQERENAKESQLCIRFENEKVEFILLKNKKLQIISPNRHSTLEDVLYYALNLLQQFEIPMKECDFLYFGPTTDEKKTEKFFKPYLPDFKSII